MDGNTTGNIPYRLVVISDTHHDLVRLERLLPAINAANYLVFCGDGITDIMHIRGKVTVPIVCVRGNNDIGLSVDVNDLATVKFGETRALVTHGHKFGVRQGLAQLGGFAAMKGCRLVFFGHTHKYADIVANGVRFINPGPLCHGSYALVAGDGINFASKQCLI